MYQLLKFNVFDFIDKETGKPVKGGKIWIMSNEPTEQRNSVGYDVTEKNISFELIEDLKTQLGSDFKLPVPIDLGLMATLDKVPKITSIRVKNK